MDLLLVEDEPQVAQLLRGRLVRVGFNVEWVASVSAAVGALVQRPYSVVLLDIVLKQGGGRPNQDGLDVARAMRRLSIGAPFVVMTGFATFEHGRAAGALNPAAVLEKGTDPRPIVEACQAAAAAAAAAALKTTGDPMGRAREELTAVAFERPEAADQCSAILFKAVGHAALTLYQCEALSRELRVLAKAPGSPNRPRLSAALAARPSSGDREVDRILSVLAAGPVASNAALATACGSSVGTIRERLKAQTGSGPTTWRCLSRGQRFVGQLVNTRDNIRQCADAAGYPNGRQSIPACRRLFGRIPSEIRRLAEL